MKKLFVFDLDGTLLNSEEKIAQENKDAIWKCKNNGNYIAYITGRDTVSTKKFVEGLPCDAYACNNGSKIFCENKLVEDNCIEFNNAVNFLKQECNNKEFFTVMDPNKCINNNSKFETSVDELENNPVDMILITNRENINTQKYNNMQFTKSGPEEIMVNSPKATKSNSLKVISNYFNISKENIVSFGDDYSDIGMFENSGTSFAMENAVQELKNIATHITTDNNSNGISKCINNIETQNPSKEYANKPL